MVISSYIIKGGYENLPPSQQGILTINVTISRIVEECYKKNRNDFERLRDSQGKYYIVKQHQTSRGAVSQYKIS